MITDRAARNTPVQIDSHNPPPSWGNLRHLAFGPIWPKSDSLPAITSLVVSQLPADLESLNIIVRLDTDDEKTRKVDMVMLRSLHSCLLFDQGLRSLGTLNITKMGRENDPAIEDIRALCELRGIRFHVADYELNRWVTRRLLDR